MPRRGFSRTGVRPPQRQIANDAFDAEVDGLVTIIGTVKAAYTFGLALVESAATLVRSRGEFSVRIAAAAAGNTIIRGAFGMIVVSTDALAIGVTALPGPLSDGPNDWFVWVPFTLIGDDTLSDAETQFTRTIVFDSRGMRKMKSGDALAPVIEVVSDLAGNTIDSSFMVRHQFKL